VIEGDVRPALALPLVPDDVIVLRLVLASLVFGLAVSDVCGTSSDVCGLGSVPRGGELVVFAVVGAARCASDGGAGWVRWEDVGVASRARCCALDVVVVRVVCAWEFLGPASGLEYFLSSE